MDTTSPSSFVVKNESISVRYYDEDGETLTYYKGRVTDIEDYGTDELHGPYVDCEVLFEDGEKVDDCRLYDKDFDNIESVDAWCFGTKSLNTLLKSLIDLETRVNSIENLVYAESESYEKPTTNARYFSWKNIAIVAIAGMFTSKVFTNYLEYMEFKKEYERGATP